MKVDKLVCTPISIFQLTMEFMYDYARSFRIHLPKNDEEEKRLIFLVESRFLLTKD